MVGCISCAYLKSSVVSWTFLDKEAPENMCCSWMNPFADGVPDWTQSDKWLAAHNGDNLEIPNSVKNCQPWWKHCKSKSCRSPEYAFSSEWPQRARSGGPPLRRLGSAGCELSRKLRSGQRDSNFWRETRKDPEFPPEAIRTDSKDRRWWLLHRSPGPVRVSPNFRNNVQVFLIRKSKHRMLSSIFRTALSLIGGKTLFQCHQT